MNFPQDQIQFSLNFEPQSVNDFKDKLPNYSQIADGWKENTKNRFKEENAAIKALKDVIKPDILSLIQEQRLNYICEGTKFLRQKKGSNSKYVFVKLSSNKKTIHHGDWKDSDSVPEIEQLKERISVSDIKTFLTGNECVQTKNNQRSDTFLTVICDNSQLELIAQNEKDFHYWCDALNTILGKEMTSIEMEKDLDMLLGHEVELRLLDLEGVKLPNKEPPIPPLPPMPIGIF